MRAGGGDGRADPGTDGGRGVAGPKRAPASREESGARTGPVRVGDLVSRVLARTGTLERVRRVGVLVEWDGIVGEQIAAVTRARSISDETLFVEVRSSAWLSELNLMRHDILRRLNAGRKEGRVERIVFVLAETPDGPGRGESAERARRPMEPEERDHR